MSAWDKLVNNLPLVSYKVKTTEDSNGQQIQHIVNDNSLIPTQYDELVLGYTGSNLTSVTYKLAAATVGTLTLSYDGSDNLSGVIRS